MGRVRRSEQQSGWHHVMNRGAGRRQIYFDDRDRIEFGRALGQACERHGVEVHAYCLMPNHFHLIVHCPDGCLSEAVQWLSGVYTRRLNERLGSDGPVLRGRFRSKPIETDTYLLAAVRYVHLNPIPILGGRPIDSYRWSSLRTFLGMRASPTWMRTHDILAHFDDDIDRFAAFHHGVGAIASEVVADLAAFALDEEVDRDGVGPKLARTVALLVADELGDAGAAVVDSLGFDSPRLAEQARSRARRRAGADPSLRRAALRTLSRAA